MRRSTLALAAFLLCAGTEVSANFANMYQLAASYHGEHVPFLGVIPKETKETTPALGRRGNSKGKEVRNISNNDNTSKERVDQDMFERLDEKIFHRHQKEADHHNHHHHSHHHINKRGSKTDNQAEDIDFKVGLDETMFERLDDRLFHHHGHDEKKRKKRASTDKKETKNVSKSHVGKEREWKEAIQSVINQGSLE